MVSCAMLLSLGLILGTTGGQGLYMQGDDIAIFYPSGKRTLGSAWVLVEKAEMNGKSWSHH